MLSTAASLHGLRSSHAPESRDGALGAPTCTSTRWVRVHRCPRCPRPRALRCRPFPPHSDSRAALLRVLQDAPVPEVVDVATEENQLGVCVLGHLAVRRGGILLRGRNHDGFPAWDPFDSTLCQGTKSAGQSYRKSYQRILECFRLEGILRLIQSHLQLPLVWVALSLIQPGLGPCQGWGNHSFSEPGPQSSPSSQGIIYS